MITRTLYNIYRLSLLMLCLTAVVACTDELGNDQTGTENPLNQDKGIGELVLFSSGNAGNITTRANVIPYMEKEGRFVCKMFYHAKATDTDASPFDTISTPITSWLRVNDLEGNSVYWQKDFNMTGVNESHQDYLDYGFDSRAQYFYWRNRLDHVFLAFTDYNKLKTNTYGTEQGKLFMYPESDGVKKTKVGTEENWNTVNYRKLVFGMIPKANPDYDASAKAERDAAITQWEADKSAWEAVHDVSEDPFNVAKPEPYSVPETIEALGLKSVDQVTTYPGLTGVSQYLTSPYGYNISDEMKQITREKILSLVAEADCLTDEQKTAFSTDLQRTEPSTPTENAGEKFRDERWELSFDSSSDAAFDADGSLNLANAVIFSRHTKLSVEDIFATAPANTFNLTRGDKTSMSQQPDPLIALTKMKPTGATQEANRVRLYFKHQFSQIQVNLTNAENTAEIKAGNIVSVELLGVSKKGYVFTNINPDGTQIPPSYDPVVISEYTEEQLKKNQYGTSFNMFEMADNEKPSSSLKSFNAIAFGQLQAIRITWKEEDYKDSEGNIEEEGVKHVATYKITVDDRGNSLVNLRSGYRYMYDFELRRGTIAFIRATIDGWMTDDELDYGTSGTIKNE